MASETDILNNALILIGEQPVLTADNQTTAGRRFLQIYPIARNSLLRAHNWNFAITRTTLAALSDTPEWGYNYQYQLPSDLLKLLQVNSYYANMNAGYYNQEDNSPYKIEGSKILTDFVAPLKIRYLKSITDTASYDACFVELLSIKVAIKLVEDLKNDSAMIDRLSQMYREVKSTALHSDAIEKAPVSQYDGDWNLSRI